jgi:hypothetical protein
VAVMKIVASVLLEFTARSQVAGPVYRPGMSRIGRSPA